MKMSLKLMTLGEISAYYQWLWFDLLHSHAADASEASILGMSALTGQEC